MLHDDRDWVSRYRPATKTPWAGRADGRFHQKFVCDDLRQPLETNPNAHNFGLIGFACDEGVRRNHGRTGAVEGPTVFRETFAKLPANIPDDWKFYDIGDITCDDGDLEASQECLGKTVKNLREQGIIPIVIGGGHEVAWGHYQGLRNDHLSIINFDAHFDIRPYEEKGSSGTPFLQMHDDCQRRNVPFSYSCFGVQPLGNTQSLFDQAHQLGITIVNSEEIDDHLSSAVNHAIEHAESIYLTICLDVFAASVAPGVSAPQPLGLMPWQILPALNRIAESGKVIGFDVAELNPQFDRDHMTAQLAAYLVSSFIHHLNKEGI